MSLNIQNCPYIEIGGPHHWKADPRHLQGIGQCPSRLIKPLMLLSIGCPLLHLNMDTHPLGITPTLMSPDRPLQDVGPNLVSLGDHQLRNVLTHLQGSDIILLTNTGIRDIDPTIRKNN